MSRDVEDLKGAEDRGDAQLHRPFGPVVVLTAEELAVLEEAHTRGLVTLPELAESQGAHPDQVATPAGASDRSSPGRVRQQAPSSSADVAAGLAQARWSLIARGLLTVDGRLPEDTDLGQFLQTLLDVEADGDFGPMTAEAVREVQQAAELEPTGVVDGPTWRAIEVEAVEAGHVPGPPGLAAQREREAIEQAAREAEEQERREAEEQAERERAAEFQASLADAAR